jgi:hypothetical protein
MGSVWDVPLTTSQLVPGRRQLPFSFTNARSQAAAAPGPPEPQVDLAREPLIDVPEIRAQGVQAPGRPFGVYVDQNAPNGPRVVDAYQRKRMLIHQNPLWQHLQLVAGYASVENKYLLATGTTMDETHLISSMPDLPQGQSAPFAAPSADAPFDPSQDPHTLIKQLLFSKDARFNAAVLDAIKLMFDGNHTVDRAYMEQVEQSGRLFLSEAFIMMNREALARLRELEGYKEPSDYTLFRLIYLANETVRTAFAKLCAMVGKDMRLVSTTRDLAEHTQEKVERKLKDALEFFESVHWDATKRQYFIRKREKTKKVYRPLYND